MFTRREILRSAGLGGLGLAAPSFLNDCGADGATGFWSPTYAATILDARIAIAQAMADTQTPSISVALCDGERIIWRETFGYIDQARSVPPGLDTLYCIGSCSKMIAAIAAMILVDRGLIDLDAPLVRYVADFRMESPDYSAITVRTLLSHAAGLPGTDYHNLFTFAPVLDYAAQVRHNLAAQRLKHPPGEMAAYCNDGFTLLEPLVAATTGRSYPRFVQDEILTPLGMRHSRFALTPFPAGSYAPAFRADGTPWPQECPNAYAAGGFYTTPGDVTRLARMLINGGEFEGVRLLSPAAVAEMGRDQTTHLSFNPMPTAAHCGLGWDDVAQPGLAAVGVTTWQKAGDTTFYSSNFLVAPQERLALLITGTSTTYPKELLAERILLNALAERGSIAGVPAPLPEVSPPEQAATNDNLAAMVGLYANHKQLLLIASQADRSLTIKQYKDGRWVEIARDLKRRLDGTFASDVQPLTALWTFTANGRGYLAWRSRQALGHYLTENPLAQRVKPAADLSLAWQARAGQRWLMVNESGQSVPLAQGDPPSMTLEKVEELPGYLLGFQGIVDPAESDTRARMFLKIPGNNGRDLDDVVIETRDGEEWVRCGGFLFRPEATVSMLVLGSNALTMGVEGLAEWRQLPVTGARASIAGATAWKLYDAELKLLASGNGDGNTGANPTGAYLLLHAAPDGVIRVTVIP